MAGSKHPRAKKRRPYRGEPERALGRPPTADEADAAVPEQQSGGFPIVGIGASAGGLDAFTELLRALPPDIGMAFVLVQHLDPTHSSMLSDILSQATNMSVTEVRPQTRVQPDHVYVIPPGKSMIISGGVLQLGARAQTPGQFRPIDQFLRSLAEDQKHQAIGVILSGGATDGTLGLEEIKGGGGITFAQDYSAQHESMPRSAIAAGCVDFELAPGAIAKELTRIARHPHVMPNEEEIAEVAGEKDMRRVLDMLRGGTGVDFSNYKRNTLVRRITRRMVLHKLNDLKEYAQFVKSAPKEVEALYQDVLISVTSFFRNPDGFEALKKRVFPKLLEKRAADDPIRIWTLGCSTGEEAYSIAIALSEFLEQRPGRRPLVQIFASDLNATLIDKARAGLYSKNIVQDVSPERLRRWFLEIDGGYRIVKPLRDMVVFARHNALTDPPFSRMDLISCRNLLIYLEPVLQQRLLPVLHYALKPRGSLWLGSSESVGMRRNLFEVEDAKQKLYTRKNGRSTSLDHVRPQRDAGDRAAATSGAATKQPPTDSQQEADRLLLTRYAPAGVLINGDLEILQFRGDTGAYLAPLPGKASLSLLKMLREGLVVAVRSAVTKAKRTHEPVRHEGLRVRSNGGYRTVHLEVIPLSTNSEETYLVLFDEPRAKRPHHVERVASRGETKTQRRADADRLQDELEATRDFLQSVIEQKEAANEELQSANEEVQSANEELQSINEELETSKEEIQSSSEELSTVNDELLHRNVELTQSNNDLINLVSSVHMAIVIVGRDLRIRRFSPLAEKLFNLIASDIGRPIADLTPRVGISGLDDMLAQAIDSIRHVEQEVKDPKGHWYSLRIRPYKTADNKIDGAVLMLVDIDVLKRTEGLLQRQAALLERTHEPILVWDLNGPITYWNKAAEEIYGYSREEALGKKRSDLLPPDVPADFFLSALEQDNKWSGELVLNSQAGEQIVSECRMWLVQEEGGPMVLETHHPITERKRMERALRTRANELALADVRKDEFLAVLAHELRNPLAPLSTALYVIREDASIGGTPRSAALEVMERQLRRMTQLVDDLMDVSRITRGRIELRLRPINLGPFLQEVVQDAQSFLTRRDQEIVLDLPEEPLYVEGDAARLEQIFGNLLSNASKFSKPGTRVHLTAERDRNERYALVTVSDTGVGISPDDLPKIFNLFMQADPSITRSHGGLGIGLNLAQELAHLHRGFIEARSAGLNQGSEFTVRLPLIEAQSDGAQQTAPANVAGAMRRILVVDDNVDAAVSLSEVLRMAGHEVNTQTSAEGALEAVATFKPDAVVLDLALPTMDGFEIARRIRAMPDGQPRVLIAVSGYGQDDHRRHSHEAGFDHHLTKPADLGLLLDLLAGSANGDDLR